MEGADQWGQIRKVRFAKGNAVVEKAWDESRFNDYGHRDAEFMNSAEISHTTNSESYKEM